MKKDIAYNQIANQNLSRLEALSDGIFAFAMTLLVLDLRTPITQAIHSEEDVQRVLLALMPRLIPYLMSFITLGIFWNGQQTQLNYFEKTDRHLSWINIGFLFMVSLVPFTTGFLAQFLTYRTALLVYWLNIVLLGGVLYASVAYACYAGFFKKELTEEMRDAMRRRILFAQLLYGFGALLCIFDTYWSIAFIMLVQLNFVLAPNIKYLSKV